MNINIDYNKRKKTEKAVLSFYSAHTSHIINDKHSKSRTKAGGYVAWPKTDASKAGNENKNFT